MANIKKLQYEGKDIYPLTHIDAIVDDSGDLIKNKYVIMTNFEGTNSFTVNPLMPDEIQQVNARLNMVADDIQNNTLGTLIDKVGDLNSLQTSNKSNAVVAINDVISNSESIQNSLTPKLDKSTYDNKIAALTQNLNSVNASTDNVKNKLITTLINNDISASNTESMESLIDKVQNISGKSNSFSFPAFLDTYNVYYDYPDEGVLPILNFHIMEEINGVLHILGGVVGPDGYASEEYNFKHYCFDMDLGTITTISTNQRCYFQAASTVYSNSIYVYGTYFYNDGYSSDSGIACYSPTTRTWSDKIPGYNIEGYGRIAGTMEVGSNNNIYVIGGTFMDGAGEGNLTTIFSYNPVNNTTTERQNPDFSVSYHASAVVGNYIYVFGGIRSDMDYNISNLVNRYNTSSNSWFSRTNMPMSIAGHCAVVQGTDVYLLGGYFYDESYAAFPAVATFCYNTSSNSYLTNARDGGIYRNSFSQAVRKDNFIYIVGGMNPANTIYHNPLAFYMIDKDTFEYGEIDDNWNPGDGTKPSVQPITIMSNKIYSGTTQFKTFGTAVTYSTSSGLTMKPNSATYHVWSALNAPIDVTDYTNVKLTFQCGTAGIHKFMIGASTSIGSNAVGNGTSLPVFNSGTSEVKPTQTFGTSAYYVVNIDISNITGSQYLTVVGCYDTETVYYINGIYITDFILE